MVRIDKNNSTIRDSHFPLPKGWRWVRLREVLEYSQYGISKKLNSEGKGLPIVRMGNIEEGKLNLSEVKFVDLPWSEAKKYLLNIGDILFNRTNSAELVGKSAVFKQQGEYVFASYLIRLALKLSEADPDFVNYVINSFIGKSYISNVSRRAIGQVNINAKEISEMPIPLPPLPEQKRIAAKIQELMQEVERARAACEKQLEAAKALPAAYLRQVFESEEAKKWERKRLGEVCEINPGRPKNFTRSPETPTTFVPMTAVDERTGTIAKPEIVPYSKVSKGYTYFEEGDVLFAKITPCMQNGKHVIAKNLIDGIGFGTTEFHVLRPSGDVLPEWVHFFIRQPHFLKEATLYFTGAVGQQRVPEEFLSNYIIPIPSLPVQERIIAELKEKMSRADKLRKSIEKQLEAINALPQAILRKAFRGEL